MDEIFRLLKKHNSGSFKKLGNNPTALTKFNYISSVLPNIDKYHLTDKADGQRAFLLIKNNIAKYVTSAGEIILPDINYPVGIFDCELVGDILYIFDVLEYNDADMTSAEFSKRLEKMCSIREQPTIKVKKYRQLTIATYQKEIMGAYKEKRPYSIDGLIFTRDGEKPGYKTTENLKWKPPEHLTIDFLYMKGAEINLFVGMDKLAWKQYGFSLPKNYRELVAPVVKLNDGKITQKYFPVPFECSLGRFYSWVNAPRDLPKWCVVELSYEGGDNTNKWKFHRIREDRMTEVVAGHSYGNNYKVAEQTLQSALNPLHFADLIESYSILTKNFYFQKSDDKYFAVRKFNNYVKKILIQRHNARAVMDLASGKGQDLDKYISAGVKKLLMLEIDMNAIEEIIQRKYTIMRKIHIDEPSSDINIADEKMNGCELSVLHMDLNAPWKKNAARVDMVPGAIFCNLALHYMIVDINAAENICAFIAHFLRPDGEFIFTAMDGAAAFNLINNGPFIVGDKYHIELKEKSNKFNGFEKIDVRLPCSIEMAEEPLINIDILDKIFKKYGMTRILYKSFSSLLPDFEKYRARFYSNIDSADKKYINLYHYCVYKKIK